ncbi:MAG: restriction endonuclease subunit S [Bacteroidales bacterium]|nr:restriction endonuclease subunit S [Bacteroidales bacterium]
MKEITFSKIVGSTGVFNDGDWVESKDQDPNGEVRLIQLADIGDGIFIDKSNRFLTREKAKQLKCTYLMEGDVLVARMPEPLGRACIFPTLDKVCVTVVDVCIIRPDSKIANNAYIKFLINSPDFRNKINRFASGTTRQRISRKNLDKISFSLPDYETQLHIANLLSKAESLIAQRKESIRLLDEYLKSVFLEMFGDPVRNEKGWEKRPFSELVAPDCPLTYGIVQPGNDFENGNPVIRPVDLTDTFVTKKGLKLIDPKISEQFKRTILNGGEILMCVRGTTGVVSIATKEVAGCNVTRGITPIWFSNNYNSLFAYSLFKTQAINNRIQELTYGATLKQINLGDLRKIELINPPLELQTKFAQIVEKTEALKAQYQQSLQELEHLYGSLSQRAFRGELEAGNLENKDQPLDMAAEPEVKYKPD